MRVAFYAPMKSPHSEVPSGDRTVARLLMAALEAAGCDVRLESELRTWTKIPGPADLGLIDVHSAQEVVRLATKYSNSDWVPDLWFTYHVYYKAPDLLGPAVADALGIPYVIAEATYAGKRDDGPWADRQTLARDAMLRADAILCFTDRDRAGLLTAGVVNDAAKSFPPFLPPHASVACPWTAQRDGPVHLAAVGMMRAGDKFESYRFLAGALSFIRSADWQLTIIGDGEMVDAVRYEFRDLPEGKVTFAGALEADHVRDQLAGADLFVWPGIGEAFGMAYLEAQALGVPVVALDTAGVPSVVRNDVSGLLVDVFEPRAFARAIELLIEDHLKRRELGRSAARYVADTHSFEAATARLSDILDEFIATRAAQE